MAEDATGIESGEDPLRPDLYAKYRDLARKYADLVGRFDRGTTHRLALQRLSQWALAATPGGVAQVEDGRIVLTNTHFLALTRSGTWNRRASGDAAFVAAPLRAFVLQQAAAMQRSRARIAEFRLHAAKDERVIAVRLERTQKGPITVLATDITEQSRRDLELQRAREALIQQERLRMLGEAAGAVAHDLGSTLRSLAFRLATLESDDRLHRKHAKTVGALSEGIEEAAATVRRLHDFARAGSLELTPVNLGILLQQAVAVLEMEHAPRGRPDVKVDFGTDELPAVRASAAELSHLFLNILRNAREAMPAGGTITIRSEVTRDLVRIAICDEGFGVDAVNMPRLFKPFFTTKQAQGTGLGLWLAAGTMKRVGGTITARRRRKGMMFTLTFPRRPLSRAASLAANRDEEPGG